MNKNNLPILIVIVLVVGLLAYKYMGGSKPPIAPPELPAQPSTTIEGQSSVKTFDVVEDSFSYSPSTITVKLGDKVKLNLTNKAADFPHDFVIDELNAKSSKSAPGGTDTLEFTADKKGTFEFYCSVGSHRAKGMVGKLIVE